MKVKTKMTISITLICFLMILIILSYFFPEILMMNVIKDITMTAIISILFKMNFNLKFQFEKYDVNIKEIKIQESTIYYEKEKNGKLDLFVKKDEEVMNKIINVYRPIEIYFKNGDFSTPHKGKLFDDLYYMRNYDFKDSSFKFTNKKINQKLENLKEKTYEFLSFYGGNVYPFDLNPRLFVTKHWIKRKEGYFGTELEEFIEIEEKMLSLLKTCLRTYIDIIDLYYDEVFSTKKT